MLERRFEFASSDGALRRYRVTPFTLGDGMASFVGRESELAP